MDKRLITIQVEEELFQRLQNLSEQHSEPAGKLLLVAALPVLGLACPSCGSERLGTKDVYDGKKRKRCKDCGKTFVPKW